MSEKAGLKAISTGLSRKSNGSRSEIQTQKEGAPGDWSALFALGGRLLFSVLGIQSQCPPLSVMIVSDNLGTCSVACLGPARTRHSGLKLRSTGDTVVDRSKFTRLPASPFNTRLRTRFDPTLLCSKHSATDSTGLLKPTLCAGIVLHGYANKRLFAPDTGDLLPVSNPLFASGL